MDGGFRRRFVAGDAACFHHHPAWGEAVKILEPGQGQEEKEKKTAKVKWYPPPRLLQHGRKGDVRVAVGQEHHDDNCDQQGEEERCHQDQMPLGEEVDQVLIKLPLPGGCSLVHPFQGVTQVGAEVGVAGDEPLCLLVIEDSPSGPAHSEVGIAQVEIEVPAFVPVVQQLPVGGGSLFVAALFVQVVGLIKEGLRVDNPAWILLRPRPAGKSQEHKEEKENSAGFYR